MVEKRKKESNFRNIVFFILISLVLIVVLIFLGFNLVDKYMILETQIIHTNFITSGNVGFDLNKTALTFGKVQPGQAASRSIFITNEFEQDIFVIVNTDGEFVDYLIVSDNNFTLMPGEERELDFEIRPPYGLELEKKYEGKVEIIFKKVSFF